MTKQAIIVGSEGQDGCLLFDLLVERGYEVIGVGKNFVRTTQPIHLQSIDIRNSDAVTNLIETTKPAEVYYLAAFHYSSEEKFSNLDSRCMLMTSMDIHVHGLINFLEAIRRTSSRTRIFYAASSLVFGNPSQTPQNEQTPFNPLCAYGISKAAGVHCCRFYRNTHGVFTIAGILYNHESYLRPEHFISQKIIRGAKSIQQNRQDRLILGDLSVIRDWGYAPDYVDAMHRLLQINKPEDVVIASGEGHTVREFVQIAFDVLGLDWKYFVREDPRILRDRQPVYIGNPQYLKKLTGWKPSISFQEMIHKLMTDNSR